MITLAIPWIGHLLRAQLVIAAAVAVLITVAALVEGHSPALSTLRSAVIPIAAYLGLAWTISAFRDAGADIALASLAHRPIQFFMALALLTAPWMIIAGAPEGPPAQWTLRSTSNGLIGRTPQGPITISWSNGHAVRSDDPLPFPGLPSPRATFGHPPKAPTIIWILRIGLLAGIIGLLTSAAAPGLARTLGVGVGAFLIAHIGAVFLT